MHESWLIIAIEKPLDNCSKELYFSGIDVPAKFIP